MAECPVFIFVAAFATEWENKHFYYFHCLQRETVTFLPEWKNKLPKNYYIGSSNSENTDKIQQVKACVKVWKDN